MNTLRLSVAAAALAACVLSAAPAAGQQRPATASAGFAMLDANRDGGLDLDEYGNDKLFSMIDRDGNDRITAAELEGFLGPQQDGTPSAADRIRNADRNTDGELDDEELRRGGETRFQWLDADRNGTLDEAEFRTGFGVPMQP